jgi:hypothetical protein
VFFAISYKPFLRVNARKQANILMLTAKNKFCGVERMCGGFCRRIAGGKTAKAEMSVEKVFVFDLVCCLRTESQQNIWKILVSWLFFSINSIVVSFFDIF